MMMSEEKQKVDNKQEEQNDNEKKNKTRLILLISAIVLLIVDIILAIIFLPKLFKKSQNDEYQVDERIDDIHDHLLTYLDNVRIAEDIGEKPVKIISAQYKNNVFEVMSQTETKALYFKLNAAFDNADSLLESFYESVPETLKYEVTVIEDDIDETKEANIIYQSSINLVTNKDDKFYLSFTGLDENETIYSCTRSEYDNSGAYLSKTSLTKESDKLLFDFYYQLIDIK